MLVHSSLHVIFFLDWWLYPLLNVDAEVIGELSLSSDRSAGVFSGVLLHLPGELTCPHSVSFPFVV